MRGNGAASQGSNDAVLAAGEDALQVAVLTHEAFPHAMCLRVSGMFDSEEDVMVFAQALAEVVAESKLRGETSAASAAAAGDDNAARQCALQCTQHLVVTLLPNTGMSLHTVKHLVKVLKGFQEALRLHLSAVAVVTSSNSLRTVVRMVLAALPDREVPITVNSTESIALQQDAAVCAAVAPNSNGERDAHVPADVLGEWLGEDDSRYAVLREPLV